MMRDPFSHHTQPYFYLEHKTQFANVVGKKILLFYFAIFNYKWIEIFPYIL